MQKTKIEKKLTSSEVVIAQAKENSTEANATNIELFLDWLDMNERIEPDLAANVIFAFGVNNFIKNAELVNLKGVDDTFNHVISDFNGEQFFKANKHAMMIWFKDTAEDVLEHGSNLLLLRESSIMKSISAGADDIADCVWFDKKEHPMYKEITNNISYIVIEYVCDSWFEYLDESGSALSEL